MRKQGFLRIPLRGINCSSEEPKLQLHINPLVLQNSDTIKREIQNDCWTTDLESSYFKLEQLAPNKQEIINPKYFDSVLFKITGETVCHEAKWYLN